ncbi:hypothetical protein ACP26L_36445 (plasmid) [Paenibacillus sp. S-38]|uniref:hypothetical protein n=1 Tax=Paenibacillus sp. S-38 TaxID=3416710 RepID=UPI003CF639AC
MMFVTETNGSGTYRYEIWRDGGVTFKEVQTNVMTNLSDIGEGKSIVSRVTITDGATVTGYAYSWV